MKAISEKWWNLSPAEKKPYEAKSEKDQATYKTNIDAWKSDRIKKEGRPKKPPGSFQIFVKEQLPSTQTDNPTDRMKARIPRTRWICCKNGYDDESSSFYSFIKQRSFRHFNLLKNLKVKYS